MVHDMGPKPMRDTKYRFLSQPRRVVEDRRFVAGKGHYIADYDHADMAHVALMPCHLPAAKIDAIDASYALTMPGVIDVCLLYTSPSPRDRQKSRMPSSA